ncbi:MAG TPA: class I SAM-dependent methyltransferase [Planctomycetota bacterium]|jgi:ubiquinone/menaquinone biosynthesis C-methylase UbiE|nr:class I SAM-dependent methyltransferase [Planctomycetota bacterium]
MKVDVDVGRVHEQNRRFHDEVEAEVYDQRMGIRYDAESTARMIAELEEVLGDRLPGGTVLDVGSGTGHVAVKLAKTGRFERVLATDISSKMLACARRNAALAGCSIETVETDMVRLPFEDASVDLVVGCAILHHLPDPVAFLPEVRRVLKPGAPCVFIGDPSTWGSRISNLMKLPLLVVYRTYKVFTGRAPKTSWEHDHIDVHTFSRRDVGPLTRGFERVRILPQGFLEPLLDIAFLTTVRERFGSWPGVSPLVSGIRWVAAKLDVLVLNHVVPGDLRVSMKFAAFRPRETASASKRATV